MFFLGVANMLSFHITLTMPHMHILVSLEFLKQFRKQQKQVCLLHEMINGLGD